jgi:dTDP-4-amino-4,6-dideoxygalactose transaminase
LGAEVEVWRSRLFSVIEDLLTSVSVSLAGRSVGVWGSVASFSFCWSVRIFIRIIIPNLYIKS